MVWNLSLREAGVTSASDQLTDGVKRAKEAKDLSAFYDCHGEYTETDDLDTYGIEEPEAKPQEARNQTLQRIDSLVYKTIITKKVSKQIKKKSNFDMELKKELKGTTGSEKLVEEFIKSEMLKNGVPHNELTKEVREENGQRAAGASTPDEGVDDESIRSKNPKKVKVFCGQLSDNLPPLNSKIVRIFTSSTFTGKRL